MTRNQPRENAIDTYSVHLPVGLLILPRTRLKSPLMLDKMLVHTLFQHHLLVELYEELLSLLTAHARNLSFKRSETKLLFQG